MICISKNSGIFAARTLLDSAAKAVQNLRDTPYRRSFFRSFSSAIGEVRNLGRATLFLLIVILFSMRTSKMKIYSMTKNSTHAATPTERNTVPKKKFDSELNAKNEDYAFILHHRLLNAFQEFCANKPLY